MGFFKKIFRMKRNNAVESPTSPQTTNTTPTNGRNGWRSSGRGNDARNTNASLASPERSRGGHKVARSPRLASPDEYDAQIPRNESFSNTYTESNSSRERDSEQYRNNGADLKGIDPRDMTQEQLRIMYERTKAATRSAAASNASKDMPQQQIQYNENLAPASSGSMENTSNGNVPALLTSNHLQQWDRQTSGSGSPLSGMGGTALASKPVYTMSTELPGQQMQAMDDMNRSDASSSSFNLSTDAEDSEYEMLRRRGGYPGLTGSSTLDTSAMDTATSYTTDEDRKIFPNLPTDDEMTQATEPSLTQPPSLLLPLSTPDDEPGKIHIIPQTNESADDLRAWTFSPHGKAAGRQDPPTTKSNTSRDQRFFPAGNSTATDLGSHPMHIKPPSTSGKTISTNAKSSMSTGGTKTDPTATASSRNTPGTAQRDFTSPKSQASTSTSFSAKEFGKGFAEGFEDFAADFGSFADFGTFPASDSGWKDGEEKKMQPWEDLEEQQQRHQTQPSTAASASTPTKQVRHQRSHSNTWVPSTTSPDSTAAKTSGKESTLSMADTSSQVDTGFSDVFDPAVSTSHISASSSGFQQDTSLSELLEAAKSKSRAGRRARSRPSTSSVNSAPAITASYLRQHHNLGGRYSTGTYQNTAGNNKDRLHTTGDGTSVSDIIESLEAAHNMKRANNNSANVVSHRSVGDTGALATARAAKERIREKRRRERESQAVNQNLSADMSDSEESDHEASESWLFDEVTGALGPRGIAADLESLSGRSNRSKNSHGNKSHKSSRRKSSRKSSSRRHRSDRSVDSHGSRTSRNSRYSHRSTKSFLSQMSEQSRSVANDLLRLERQLAMVASEENREDAAARPASSSASLGGTSRGNSRSTNRRAATSSGRTNVTAPANSICSSVVRRTRINVMAPPGRLGIILANKADSKGTVVSGVRTSSVLVNRISPGDRIVAIDGEDVSRMTVCEITTIMSRKAEYERRLTVLTIPRTGSNTTSITEGGNTSHNDSNNGTPNCNLDGVEPSFASNYRR